MATTTTKEERLARLHDRIDKLEASARAAPAAAKTRIQPHIDALRQKEASARAAAREVHEKHAQESFRRNQATNETLDPGWAA